MSKQSLKCLNHAHCVSVKSLNVRHGTAADPDFNDMLFGQLVSTNVSTLLPVYDPRCAVYDPRCAKDDCLRLLCQAVSIVGLELNCKSLKHVELQPEGVEDLY